MIGCVYETRPESEPGLLLLATTLDRSSPGLRLRIYFDSPSIALRQVISKNANFDLVQTEGSLPPGVNVKPSILLNLLRDGYKEVVWLDSDVLVTRDVLKLFEKIDPSAIVLTEEGDTRGYTDLDSRRARLWGFPVGRSFPFVLNTAVVRVNQGHIPLLTEWKECLESDFYMGFQEVSWCRRPMELMSDQDVLHALLCSKRYSNVPVCILRRGVSIYQEIGWRPITTLSWAKTLRLGVPQFVHAQNTSKPWLIGVARERGLRSYVDQVRSDFSIYKACARELLLSGSIEGLRSSWFEPKTRLAALVIELSRNNIIILLLVNAILSDFVMPVLGALGVAKRKCVSWAPWKALCLIHRRCSGSDVRASSDAGRPDGKDSDT